MRCAGGRAGRPRPPTGPRRSARRPGAARRRRGVRRRDRRLRRRAGRSRRRCSPRPGSTWSCSRPGPYLDRRLLPGRAAGGAGGALPRRRPDDRRGPAGDPDPGRPRRRRHDRDQLRHLLPGTRRRARALALRARNRVGHASWTPTTPRPRRCCRWRRWTRSAWGETDSCFATAPTRSASATTRCERNAGRCFQCSSCPNGCRLDAKRAMHVSYLPRAVAAGARMRAGVEARRVLFEGARAVGVEGRAGVAWHQNGAPTLAERDVGDGAGRPYRCTPAAPWCWPAAPSALRSCCCGPASTRPAAAGPNLRIHPACWVGARFDEEVRGWDGRDAELRRRRVAGPRPPARGDVHATGLRRAMAAGHRAPPTRSASSPTTASPRPACTSPTAPAGRVGLASDGSLRITYRLTDADAATLAFGIARAAELF